jgi:hypothetical protein
MSLETLVVKYIESAEIDLQDLQIQGSLKIDEQQINQIIEYVKDYLADAKYYRTQNRLETSLISVAYCEGLLDALRLLGAVKFEWPQKPITKEK